MWGFGIDGDRWRVEVGDAICTGTGAGAEAGTNEEEDEGTAARGGIWAGGVYGVGGLTIKEARESGESAEAEDEGAMVGGGIRGWKGGANGMGGDAIMGAVGRGEGWMGVVQGVSCVIWMGDWTRKDGEGSGVNGEGGGRGGTGLSSVDIGEKTSGSAICCWTGDRSSLRLCTSGLATVSLPLENGGSKEAVEEFRSAKSVLGVLSRLTLVVGGSEDSGSRDGGGTRLLASFVGDACLGGSSDVRLTFCQSSSISFPEDPDGACPLLLPFRKTLNRRASFPRTLVRFSFFSGTANDVEDSGVREGTSRCWFIPDVRLDILRRRVLGSVLS